MKEAEVETLWDRDGAKSAYQTRVKSGHFRIHIFWRGDRDPDMHDHPADFWTFPLVSYVEEFEEFGWLDGELVGRRTTTRVVCAFRFHHRKAEFSHRVLGSYEGESFDSKYHLTGTRPIVTLGWWGKKRRDWGFHTASGWVPWKDYVSGPGWSQPQDEPLARAWSRETDGLTEQEEK